MAIDKHFLFVTLADQLPVHNKMINLHLYKRPLLSKVVVALFIQGQVSQLLTSCNLQWRFPCHLYLIPYFLIAGALWKEVCHWQSIDASLPWHYLLQQHLRPRPGEGCMQYHFHAVVAFSQMSPFLWMNAKPLSANKTSRTLKDKASTLGIMLSVL